jgi:cytochrome b561
MNPTLAPTADISTQDYSAPLRAWHWGNALLVSGQLLTILFQRVIVNARSAVPEFQETLGRENIALSEKQARSLTHIISERIWEWHIYLGLALAAFWLVRVILELRGPSSMRFSARLLEVARRYRLAAPADKSDAGSALFAKSTYALFYVLLTIMVITGLVLTWANDFAFLESMKHTAEEVHNVTMYLIIAFFVVHVVGVVWSELTKSPGLTSKMIGGPARLR